MHKLSINISDKDHRIFKIYAAAKSQTLSEVVIDSVKDKIARDMKSPNNETKQLYKKSVHQILGVKANASPEEIKKAYRGFLKFHPDKPTGDKEKFQMYATAYRGMINSINIK